jgi:predicted RNA binding protein YcfA (HicA-like mRNA interferase family)
MPKLRQLNGADVVKILESFGFLVTAQKGSHIKLTRLTTASKEVLTIPNHKSLKTGTSKAIYNQATRYIGAEELQKVFIISDILNT